MKSYSKEDPLTPQMLRDMAEYHYGTSFSQYGLNGYPEQARALLWEPFGTLSDGIKICELCRKEGVDQHDGLAALYLFNAELLEDEMDPLR